MRTYLESSIAVEAEVQELMPRLGLAFVVDDSSRTWGVTRSMPGLDFESLAPGRRVRLLIGSNPGFSVVRECQLVEGPGLPHARDEALRRKASGW